MSVQTTATRKSEAAKQLDGIRRAENDAELRSGAQRLTLELQADESGATEVLQDELAGVVARRLDMVDFDAYSALLDLLSVAASKGAVGQIPAEDSRALQQALFSAQARASKLQHAITALSSALGRPDAAFSTPQKAESARDTAAATPQTEHVGIPRISADSTPTKLDPSANGATESPEAASLPVPRRLAENDAERPRMSFPVKYLPQVPVVSWNLNGSGPGKDADKYDDATRAEVLGSFLGRMQCGGGAGGARTPPGIICLQEFRDSGSPDGACDAREAVAAAGKAAGAEFGYVHAGQLLTMFDTSRYEVYKPRSDSTRPDWQPPTWTRRKFAYTPLTVVLRECASGAGESIGFVVTNVHLPGGSEAKGGGGEDAGDGAEDAVEDAEEQLAQVRTRRSTLQREEWRRLFGGSDSVYAEVMRAANVPVEPAEARDDGGVRALVHLVVGDFNLQQLWRQRAQQDFVDDWATMMRTWEPYGVALRDAGPSQSGERDVGARVVSASGLNTCTGFVSDGLFVRRQVVQKRGGVGLGGDAAGRYKLEVRVQAGIEPLRRVARGSGSRTFGLSNHRPVASVLTFEDREVKAAKKEKEKADGAGPGDEDAA
ncbi:unnamed protein product [Pedinophyceae sp. YPF-701]|nr:unnamed protein product [Pedinophyceae sp. YPF-701]